MPTGSSRGSNSVRAPVSAQTRKIAPASADSGQQRAVPRADEQPHGVREDQPDEPDRAAHRDERAREQGGADEQQRAAAADVHAEGGRRGVAERERVERAGAREQRHADERRSRRRRCATEVQSAPAREPSSQLRISR